MKVKVIIQEIISQEFEVEIDDMVKSYDRVLEEYKNGNLVVDNPSINAANVMICDENGNETEWLDLHV